MRAERCLSRALPPSMAGKGCSASTAYHFRGSLPPLFPTGFLQAVWPGMESTAMDTSLHPRTPGVTPASDSPLHCAVWQGKPILFNLFIYLVQRLLLLLILRPPPPWLHLLGLGAGFKRHRSPEEPPKIVSRALSWLLPADQTRWGAGALLAPHL